MNATPACCVTPGAWSAKKRHEPRVGCPPAMSSAPSHVSRWPALKTRSRNDETQAALFLYSHLFSEVHLPPRDAEMRIFASGADWREIGVR